MPHARRNIESRAALDLQVGNVDRLPLVGGEFEKLCSGNVLARERRAENVPRRIPSRLECNLYNRLLVHREAAEVRRTRTARCVGLAHGKPVFARFVFEGGNRLFVFLYPESSRITVAVQDGYAAYVLVFVFSADILARRVQNVEEARADCKVDAAEFARLHSFGRGVFAVVYVRRKRNVGEFGDVEPVLGGTGRGERRRKRKCRKQSGEKCFFHIVFCCCLLLL